MIKLVGGGIGPIGQIRQEVVSEILEKQVENGFFKNLLGRFWFLRNA